MAEVSVIVPVYNGAKTMKRCIQSILAQTFSDTEIIVVNDGSTDNTLQILSEIQDGRISVITTDNRGQGFARNAGIAAATGKYLAFVDADDTIDKEMLSVLYSAAEKEHADIAECNILDIFPNGEEKKQLAIQYETVEITDKGKYMDEYFTTCRHSYEVCNKLIRRECIGDVRFRDTRRYFSEDLLFNLEIISRIRRITFVDKPLYNYYQSETSHLHKNAEKRLEGLISLFSFYMKSADNEMKRAASYTAAMILSYSSGECAESRAARAMYKCREFKEYIKTALTRNVKKKHRLFLKSMSLAPACVKARLCKWYSGRWTA